VGNVVWRLVQIGVAVAVVCAVAWVGQARAETITTYTVNAVDDSTHSDNIQYTDSVSGIVTTDSAGDIISAALTVSLNEFESLYEGSFIAQGSNFFSADTPHANSAAVNGLTWSFTNPSGTLNLSFNSPPAPGVDNLSATFNIDACFTTISGSSSFSTCQFGGTDTIEGSITDVAESVTATPIPAALPLFAGCLGFVCYLARRRKRSVKQALVAA
jgi:hypothetical protein